MRILVAVDDSKYSGDILRAIVTQRRPDSTEVMVLHVLQPVGPAPPQMHQGYAPEMERGTDGRQDAGRANCHRVA